MEKISEYFIETMVNLGGIALGIGLFSYGIEIDNSHIAYIGAGISSAASAYFMRSCLDIMNELYKRSRG
jgi:hypothetical protein